MEQAALERAHAGDEQAFRNLTDPYRRELLAHCYRLLGSLTEAEDMLQETLLAAWRGLAGFEGRSSLRSWLYRIATNICLNAVRASARRIPIEPMPPFQPPEPTQRDEIRWLQPYPDTLLEGIADTSPGPEARYSQSEAIELAFVAGLQRMPPRQAAAVLLRDVLGFGTEEVAAMLKTSPTAIKGTLQRGRAALENSRNTTHGSTPLPRSAEERELARRFADAYVAADIDGVLALLTDDAWLSMPPAPHQYQGLAAIRSFLEASLAFRGERRVYLIPGRANNQSSFASYLSDQQEPIARPAGLFVLTLADNHIRALTRFHYEDLHPLLGFPASLNPLIRTRSCWASAGCSMYRAPIGAMQAIAAQTVCSPLERVRTSAFEYTSARRGSWVTVPRNCGFVADCFDYATVPYSEPGAVVDGGELVELAP